MRLLKLLSVALCLSMPAALRAGEEPAKAVITKAIKAAGLDKDADKPYADTWKDKGTFNFMGQKMDYLADWIFQAPDKYRFELNMEAMGQKIEIKMGLDGTKAFESALGMQRTIEGDKLDYIKSEAYQFWVMSLNPLVKDKEFKLKLLGDAKVGDRAAVSVQVERAGRPAVKLYFAKDTGLLHKLDITVKNELDGWKDALDEAFFDDYKDQDGRKVFTKLRVHRNGHPLIESTLSEARRIAPVDVKRFQEP
jgi:hypothetical protein